MVPKIKKYKIITLQNEENNFNEISEFKHLLDIIKFVFVIEYDRTISDDFSGSCTYFYKVKILDNTLNESHITTENFKVDLRDYCIRISAWDNIKADGFSYTIYDKLGRKYPSSKAGFIINNFSNIEGVTPIKILFQFLELICKFESFNDYESFKKAKLAEAEKIKEEQRKKLKETEEAEKLLQVRNKQIIESSSKISSTNNKSFFYYIKAFINNLVDKIKIYK